MKEKSSFLLGGQHRQHVPKLKYFISDAHSTPLQYYQRDLPITVQEDASRYCLSTCVLHHIKPIAFSSNSLMDAETQYDTTEWDLLAYIYACEHLHTYFYDHSFTGETDHKTSEMITPKTLTATPLNLQRMLLLSTTI